MKQLYIDALNGVIQRINPMVCENLAMAGMVTHEGDNWDSGWKFDQEFLNAGTEQQLKQMYEDLTNE